MDRIDFEKIIADLGEALGMDISFDDEGVCELVVRDSFGVSLKKSEEDGTLMMFSSLGADLPDPADYGLVQDLLEFNLGAASGASCAVGRDPEAGMLVAWQLFPASRLVAEPVVDLFVRFVQSRIALANIVEGNISSANASGRDGGNAAGHMVFNA
jgi:hypothetical protein